MDRKIDLTENFDFTTISKETLIDRIQSVSKKFPWSFSQISKYCIKNENKVFITGTKEEIKTEKESRKNREIFFNTCDCCGKRISPFFTTKLCKECNDRLEQLYYSDNFFLKELNRKRNKGSVIL